MRVTVEGITVYLGTNLVLRNISLDILSGSSTAVVGLSGCGKTTLLRTIAGLVEPKRGTVRIDGLSPQSTYGQGILAFLFQEAYLWQHLTVAQNLELVLRLHRRAPDSKLIKAQLARVGLEHAEKLYPYQLSVGMRARAAIARAHCVPPQVLLMDEPFAALDPLRRLDLNRQVQDLRREYRSTVIWVTHEVTEALQFASQIVAFPQPPQEGVAVFDLQGMPPIADPGRLPDAAIRLRDRILQTIQGGAEKSEVEVRE